MTLRDKIAETISIKFDHQIEPDDYVDEIADAILNLPELKELQEKLDLIMEGLVVEEKIGECIEGNSKCGVCQDTITRPATPEEVREMIEIAFKFSDSHWMHDNVNHAWGYQLKPGAVLRLEVKKT